MKITIRVENDHGTFSESFSDKYAAAVFLDHAPDLRADPPSSPGREGGAAFAQSRPPQPTDLLIELFEGRAKVGDVTVTADPAVGAERGRQRLCDAAARALARTPDDKPTPAYQVVDGAHGLTQVVFHHAAKKATFIMPAFFQQVGV